MNPFYSVKMDRRYLYIFYNSIHQFILEIEQILECHDPTGHVNIWPSQPNNC